MAEEKNTNEKIEINIDNTDSALNWLERILKLIKEYGTGKIIWATFLIVVVSFILYFMFNLTKIFDLYNQWVKTRHDERIELRMEMSPKIQSSIDKLTYNVNATRTLVLELHNGVTGSGGLPFSKCTATYESLNIGEQPIAPQYQDVNLSLLPFATKLFHEGYWCGNTEELKEIDKGLYYKMKSNGTEHFAACIIEGVENKAIAFMIISFNTKSDDIHDHDCQEVRNKIRHIAMELSVILEVTRILGE